MTIHEALKASMATKGDKRAYRYERLTILLYALMRPKSQRECQCLMRFKGCSVGLLSPVTSINLLVSRLAVHVVTAVRKLLL
jgi:hypothetical protein